MPRICNNISKSIVLCLILITLIGSFPFSARPVHTPITPKSTTNSMSNTSAELLLSELQSSNQESDILSDQINNIPIPNCSSSFLILGNLLVVYGNYVNETTQEPITVWTNLFQHLGFNTTATHIDAFNQSSEFDLVIVTPSVGTSNGSFGVSSTNAAKIGNCKQPILLLGYAHEVLDRLKTFDPILDFVPCVERYLWSQNHQQQFFSFPFTIPVTNGRFGIYSDHVSYDAYRFSSLPSKTEVLGTNYGESGAQLLWFRAFSVNPQIYYWGLDRVGNLNSYGRQFCENLIHWIIRPTLQKRLGELLSALQLPDVDGEDYWAIQGGGGFGYPLEPSLRFSYYVTDIVETNGLVMNLSNFEPWLLGCYNSELGCFEDLASLQLFDRCITTAMSVLMAEDLGILDQINQTQIILYLKNCQDTFSGGFFTELGSSETSLSATRYAIQSLSVLEQLPTLNIQAVIDYVANCQELNPFHNEYGGFYSSDNGGLSTSLVNALDAIITLEQFDALNAINQSALLTFLANCEDPNGSSIFDTRQFMDSDEWILGTSCAIQILTLLNTQGSFDTDISREFVVANQFPNGGWGRGDLFHDFHNSPDETWFGAQALALTGGLGETEFHLIQYLNQCCTGWGGASEPSIFGDFLTGTEVIFALTQVDALQILNQTAYLKYLENCWSQSYNSFVAHQLPSSIGTNTDKPTPDRIALESGTYGPLYHYAFSQLISVLNLTDAPWTNFATQIQIEIKASQSDHPDFKGMFGLHHLYIGHESNLTFRFDTTCWSLLAHQALGGDPADLNNSSAALSYLTSCLQTTSTHQYFFDPLHSVPLPAPWRVAEGYLAETWLGLQANYYLDTNLTGLDGQKLAQYVVSLLQENASIITTFYATEILHLLVETGLNPEALNQLEWSGIQEKILEAFVYDGFVNDSSLPQGKWMPHLVNLGLKLIHRFQLLSQLDENPILNLTEFIYSTGTLPLGSNFSFSATVKELRWGQVPTTIRIQTQIFKTHFLNFCSIPYSGYLESHVAIPVTASALGLQNLTLCAYSPGAIPFYASFSDICTGWGILTLQTDLSQNTTTPRGIPLNITMQLGLEGAIIPPEQLNSASVSVTLETTNETYLSSLEEQNQYHASITTQNLTPTNHLIRINASALFCTPYTSTTIVSIIVYDTYITLNQTNPSPAVLLKPITIEIGLWNMSGFPLSGYSIDFNITRPNEILPLISLNGTTNQSGFIQCSWIPDVIGQWKVIILFYGQDMFGASQKLTTIQISRRPLAMITPTISLIGAPLEVNDPFLQPTLDIVVRLTYINNSHSYGLVGNLSLQIQSQDSHMLLTFFLQTNSSGTGELTITTPQPGFYTVTINFEGQTGFTPCSLTTPFLVRYSQSPLADIYSLLLFGSITLMILGLISGVFIFLRLQQRLNKFLQGIHPSQESFVDTTSYLLLSDTHPVSESEPEPSTESSVE